MQIFDRLVNDILLKFSHFIFRRKCIDRLETIPFLNSGANPTIAPSAPTYTGTATINRTLLHHQQNHGINGVPTTVRNGATSGTLRGLAISTNNDSPPPDYNIVVHDIERHGFIYITQFFF